MAFKFHIYLIKLINTTFIIISLLLVKMFLVTDLMFKVTIYVSYGSTVNDCIGKCRKYKAFHFTTYYRLLFPVPKKGMEIIMIHIADSVKKLIAYYTIRQFDGKRLTIRRMNDKCLHLILFENPILNLHKSYRLG